MDLTDVIIQALALLTITSLAAIILLLILFIGNRPKLSVAGKKFNFVL